MIEKTYPITEKLLDTGFALSRELLELLTQEETQLKNRTESDTLSMLAEDKKKTAAELEQFSKQLSQVLATENLSLDHEGIRQYFAKARATGLNVANAADHWRQITDIAAQCRTVNERNGAAIALLLRHNQRSMQIIRGKSQASSTYGPDGATRSERFSQSLASV